MEIKVGSWKSPRSSLQKVGFLFQSIDFMRSAMETPATCAAEVAAALVQCALKAVALIPASCRRDYNHFGIITKWTGLKGLQ